MYSTSPPKRAAILALSQDTTSAMARCAELTLAGWQTLFADDLLEALTALRSRRIGLVMLIPPLDEMLKMDLPAVLREAQPMAYLPIVIMGAGLSELQACQYLDGGADDVICDGDISHRLVNSRLCALLRVKDLHDQLAASRGALQTSLGRERRLRAQLRRENHQLHALATTDPLTHLQNVRSFRGILAHEFRNARRYNQPLSMLMLDVDHFKLVNDSFGHPSGDYVLKELAVILTRSVRESDVVARTGGEEFSILLPRADTRRASVFGSRIRREVAAHRFRCYGQDIAITISIGAASFPADAEITEHDMLLYFADQALLTAKETGRDRVVLFGELDAEVRRRLNRQYACAVSTANQEPVDVIEG